MKNNILFAALIALLASCQFNTPKEPESKTTTEIQTGMDSEFKQGVAKEVLQTNNYTYLLLNYNGQDIWVAGPRMEAAVGEMYYFVQNMEMENFKSKELNRTFDRVIFAQEISKNQNDFEKKSQNQGDYKSDVKIAKQNVKINLAKGITSIGEVYANKTKLAGTTITVKGVVTKYNAQIMDKNWVHLQDGTEKDGYFDLVITTQVSAKLGDTLTLAGKVTIDKDFGYGYKYDVLIEDAVKK